MDSGWIEAGTLPYPLAYSACVSVRESVYVLGGETWDDKSPAGAAVGNHATAEVLRLRWNGSTRQVDVERNALPPLPRACQYHAATSFGEVIYVVASHTRTVESRRLDESHFWSLDLAAPAGERTWKSLPVWPGPPREKMAFVALGTSTEDAPGRGPSLYLMGGATWAKQADGTPDDANGTHFDDGYRFDLATRTWTPIASLLRLNESRTIDTTGYEWDAGANRWRRVASPVEQRSPFSLAARPLAAAPAIRLDDAHLLLFSGATGRYVTLDVQDRPNFPNDFLIYDARSDVWQLGGLMPAGSSPRPPSSGRGGS
ncbi:MAG: hypothetical protein R3B90_18500 [Planctomycetaceae bacterium]